MNLDRINPPAEEFIKTLVAFDLLPDLWIKHPILVAGAMRTSEFWAMSDNKGRTIGLVWLSNIIPGESADIHIVVNKDVRNYLRPPKLDREKMLHRQLHDSMHKVAAFWFILDHAFEGLGLQVLGAAVPAKRLNALRMIQRLGFTVEGTLRDRVSIGGERDSVVVASILRREYEQMRQETFQEEALTWGT